MSQQLSVQEIADLVSTWSEGKTKDEIKAFRNHLDQLAGNKAIREINLILIYLSVQLLKPE